MQKKLLSLALALVMCLGLAVPAFATEKSGAYELTINGPEGYEPEQVKNTYQVLECKWESHPPAREPWLKYAENPKEMKSISAWTIPMGTEITISGLHAKGGDYMGVTEKVYIDAWSDPDGDGIYEERSYRREAYQEGDEYDIRTWDAIPLTEKGPFERDEKFDYVRHLTADELDISALAAAIANGEKVEGYAKKDSSGAASLCYPMDMFYEMYGPNTILFITVGKSVGWNDFLADKRTFTFLLSEESEPEPEEPEEPAKPAVTFTDVAENAYYAASVAWAVENGITAGTTATTFSPANPCTQQQILTFLYRAQRNINGTPAPASSQDLLDAMQWADEKGMIDASFDPEATCTRATAVSYIWQAMGEPEAAASSFTDVPAAASYAAAVNWAVEKGVTSGTGNGKFSPDNACDRGTIMTFLYRAFAQ